MLAIMMLGPVMDIAAALIVVIGLLGIRYLLMPAAVELGTIWAPIGVVALAGVLLAPEGAAPGPLALGGAGGAVLLGLLAGLASPFWARGWAALFEILRFALPLVLAPRIYDPAVPAVGLLALLIVGLTAHAAMRLYRYRWAQMIAERRAHAEWLAGLPPVTVNPLPRPLERPPGA